MASIIKVDTIQDQDGNNIINESANTITIGASGDTITIPSGATLANSGIVTGFQSTGIDDNATSTAITIDSNENVGIGTASPNNYSGYGTLTLNGTSGGIFDLEVNGTRTGTLLALVGETRLSSITDIPLTFCTNNAEKMRLTSTGLGIGTSLPIFLNRTGSALSKTIGLYNSGTSVSQRAELQLGNAATASGNLTSGVLFGCGASDTTKNTLGSIFGIIDATSTTTASGALTFWTATSGSGVNTERMRIDSSGNVGIGTSSPSEKLDVVGKINTTEGVGGTPAFRASTSGTQSITQNTWTKIQLNSEEFDTNSNFDPTTNYRFTPTVAGYYQFNGFAQINAVGSYSASVSIYKNGAASGNICMAWGGNDFPKASASTLLYANGSTDYFELYVRQDSAAAKNLTSANFSGALARAS